MSWALFGTWVLQVLIGITVVCVGAVIVAATMAEVRQQFKRKDGSDG